MAYLGFVDIFNLGEETPAEGEEADTSAQWTEEVAAAAAAVDPAMAMDIYSGIRNQFTTDAVSDRIRSRDTIDRRAKQRTTTVVASSVITGAAAGSVIGPIGMAIGAGVGAVGGLVYHLTAGKKQKKKEKKIRQQLIMQQQAAEAAAAAEVAAAKRKNEEDIKLLTAKARFLINSTAQLSSTMGSQASKLNRDSEYDNTFYELYIALANEAKSVAEQANETIIELKYAENDLETDLAATYTPELEELLQVLNQIQADARTLVNAYKPQTSSRPDTKGTNMSGYNEAYYDQAALSTLSGNPGLGNVGCGGGCPCGPCAGNAKAHGGLAGMGDLTNWLKDTRNNNRAALGLPPAISSVNPMAILVGIGAAFYLLRSE